MEESRNGGCVGGNTWQGEERHARLRKATEGCEGLEKAF